MKKLMILCSCVFVMMVMVFCQACGKKGSPQPPKEYGKDAIQSGATDDFCE